MHTHTHTHTYMYVVVHSVTAPLLSIKKREEGMKREGKDGMKEGRVGGRQLFFGHRTLFTLVHIYGTHMFCGPSFII